MSLCGSVVVCAVVACMHMATGSHVADGHLQGSTDSLRLQTCVFTALLGVSCWACRHVVTIDGYEDVPKNDEFALKKAISQQPVAVGICASQAMQFYRCVLLLAVEPCAVLL